LRFLRGYRSRREVLVAKRRTNRRVVIRLKGRDPSDPLKLLLAVEEAFRPESVEVICERPEQPVDVMVALDERLETEAREQAAEVLDQKDRVSRTASKSQPASRGPEEPAADEPKSIRTWLRERMRSGWRIVVKCLPTAGKVATLAKTIKEIFYL
jgi:hypothetical protein